MQKKKEKEKKRKKKKNRTRARAKSDGACKRVLYVGLFYSFTET